MGIRVLVVEDDPAVAAVVRDMIAAEGYEVDLAEGYVSGLAKATAGHPALIVLDLNLPDGDGLKLCRELKGSPATRDQEIFMLTARGTAEDIVAGLEAGAEDYLAKPFHQRELLARLRRLLRRAQAAPAGQVLLSGGIRLCPASHELALDGVPAKLTLREFEILQAFMEREGQAMTREEIIMAAWGPGFNIVPKVVDIHISHLRQKLGAHAKRVVTVPQIGYKLAPAPKRWLG